MFWHFKVSFILNILILFTITIQCWSHVPLFELCHFFPTCESCSLSQPYTPKLGEVFSPKPITDTSILMFAHSQEFERGYHDIIIISAIDLVLKWQNHNVRSYFWGFLRVNQLPISGSCKLFPVITRSRKDLIFKVLPKQSWDCRRKSMTPSRKLKKSSTVKGQLSLYFTIYLPIILSFSIDLRRLDDSWWSVLTRASVHMTHTQKKQKWNTWCDTFCNFWFFAACDRVFY